jgi:hypothetical protein
MIISVPILVFCVTELLLVMRVCALCKLLITNKLLRAKFKIITDNGKVVTPTKIAVSYIDHFPLLPLKFVIWSLRGLLAGELHHYKVNIAIVLDLCFSRCSCRRYSCTSTV